MQISERIRSGLDEGGRQTTFCASGIHPDGTCSCDSLFMGEESSTFASISRIVMLSEALFEVDFFDTLTFTFLNYLLNLAHFSFSEANPMLKSNLKASPFFFPICIPHLHASLSLRRRSFNFLLYGPHLHILLNLCSCGKKKLFRLSFAYRGFLGHVWLFAVDLLALKVLNPSDKLSHVAPGQWIDTCP